MNPDKCGWFKSLSKVTAGPQNAKWTLEGTKKLELLCHSCHLVVVTIWQELSSSDLGGIHWRKQLYLEELEVKRKQVAKECGGQTQSKLTQAEHRTTQRSCS